MNTDQMKKINIDPDKVIKTEPKMVKQPSPFAMGFFYGWMALYLIMKLFDKI
jgi:hypothetical protein